MKATIHAADLIGKTYEFGRTDGYFICRLVFRENGVLSGTNHPNETSWDIRDDFLFFLDAEGQATTRFTELVIDAAGWRLIGTFLPENREGHHVLKPIIPDAAPAEQRRRAEQGPARHTLAIARYNESLDWIDAIPADFRVIVYNKGDIINSQIVLNRADNIIQRENIGREAETYLHHMIMADEADPQDFTVFTQADPFEHSPHFIELIRNWRSWSPLQALAIKWKPGVPPAPVLENERFDYLADLGVRSEFFSLFTMQPLHFFDQGQVGLSGASREVYGVTVGDNLVSAGFRAYGLDDIADAAARHLVGRFAYGAIFATRNEFFQALPIRSLELMHEFCARPAQAHFIERLWLHLLGAEFLLPIPKTRF